MIGNVLLLLGAIQVAVSLRSDLISNVTCNLPNYHVGDGQKSISGHSPGENVTLTCRPGYYFDRTRTTHSDYDYNNDGTDFIYDTAPREVTCAGDGRWEPIVSECHAFTCRRPKNPRNGAVRPKDQTLFSASETITYVCRKGTVLVGLPSSTCEMAWNGWTHASRPPTCYTIRCPVPEAPLNGWLNRRDRHVGAVAKFHCHRGYELYGSSNLTCESNGRWFGTTPICKKVGSKTEICDNPVVLPGSNSLGRSDQVNSDGAQAAFECHDPYYLRGPAKRKCGPLGWSPTSEPECESLYGFDDPDVLARTFTSMVERFSASDDNSIQGLTSRRFDLYFLIDSSQSIQTDHFEFAKLFVENLIEKINMSRSGNAVCLLSFAGDAEHDFREGGGQHGQPGTPKKTLLNLVAGMKHRNTDTNITGALEFVRKVMIPLTINARRSTREVTDSDVPKVVFLFTDGDYTHGGNPSSSAEALRALGVEIFTFKIGSVSKRKTNKVLRDVSSSADFPLHYPHYLRIKDKGVLDHMLKNVEEHRTVGAQIPEYPVCGVAGDVDFSRSYDVGGDVVNSTTWPWLMAINKVLTTQGKSPVQTELICTGTLISERWVLTTTGCLEGDPTLIVKSAASPHLFDGSIVESKFKSTDHGNDEAALLYLQQPMRVSPYVRPVCLPNNTTDFNDDTDDYAVTTGWNVTSSDTPNMMQAAVPLLETSHCGRGSLYREYCTGLPPSGGRTIRQDIGSPLMVRTKMDKATRATHWIQIGFAGNSPTTDYTGRYKKLEPYLPWIRRTMLNK